MLFGVYRQWGNRQKDEVLGSCNKINKASEEDKEIIAMGDWNVDSKKFNDKTYQRKRICSVIMKMVHSNDLKIADLPYTFISRNHDYKSALDHIYFSSTLEDKISCKATDQAATDHLPIMFELEMNIIKAKDKKHKLIRKKCFKGF